MSDENQFTWQKLVFILLGFACLTPYVSPPIALALGLFAALTFGNPYVKKTGKYSKLLLQISVVGLGFGMNLQSVLQAGRDGILFTIATIFGTLILGFFVGKFLKIDQKISHLISSGTAICGGSAIAAVAPVIEADDKEISVSMGTVFILNSIALFIFPIIGHALNLTDKQFGIWSAIAIHDTSSVVGAAAKFSTAALQIATTVKLARALWIVPIALGTAYFYKGKSTKVAIPYFIGFFLLASIVRSYAPPWVPPSLFESMVLLAKQGLTLTLFFIGAGLSFATLKSVGVRPLVQGVFLWIVISCVSLWAVLQIL